jgi:hypothetical protein
MASNPIINAVRFIPVIGYKIAQVVEGVDNEYTRQWAWRPYGKGRFDSMRLNNKTDREKAPPVLSTQMNTKLSNLSYRQHLRASSIPLPFGMRLSLIFQKA